MEQEQEGIELETVDPIEEGIRLPAMEEVTEGNEKEEAEVPSEVSIDEEKESLKRGVNNERHLRKMAEKKNRELEARIKALEEAKLPEKTVLDELVEKRR